mmetsp:Transcript_38827/g.85230  ORF Transcript_38827/g.85230 Transcript_38827/m.85230 type:complete len:122 (-) Transcript_38827:133-498(-)
MTNDGIRATKERRGQAINKDRFWINDFYSTKMRSRRLRHKRCRSVLVAPASRPVRCLVCGASATTFEVGSTLPSCGAAATAIAAAILLTTRHDLVGCIRLDHKEESASVAQGIKPFYSSRT